MNRKTTIGKPSRSIIRRLLAGFLFALALAGCGKTAAFRPPAETIQELPADEAFAIVRDIAVPAYTDEPVFLVNGGRPFFSEEEKAADVSEDYAPLDELGRCGPAFAKVGPETLPEEERGLIGNIRPSGWQTVKYEGIDGNFLYNRCHLIAYSLTAENENERNLITGTRYLNIIGMLPYEMEVTAYVHRTGNHVLYRATPVFSGDELLARGVLLEAFSLEDHGAGICFCVFCYNIQPGVAIDYATGESSQYEIIFMEPFQGNE